MPTTEELFLVRLEAKLSQFEREMARANKTAKSTASSIQRNFQQAERRLSSFGSNAFRGFFIQLAALAGAGATIRNFVTKTVEQQKVVAQLEAVLSSTADAVGLSSRQLQNLASELQSTTTYGDEAVISAENLLLTFTKIGGEVFPQALETVLDMSTALGQDLKSSAVQLGKALQDPIVGVTALRRVGVNFSEDQKNVIKALVETNRLADAQAIILRELQVEFGGSAVAARSTLGGALQSLSNAWGDLFELSEESTEDLRLAIEDLIEVISDPKFKQDIADIGSGLVEGFGFAAREAQKFLEDIRSIREEIGTIVGFIQGMGDAVVEAFTEDTEEIKARIVEVEAELDRMRADDTGLISPFAVNHAIEELERLRAKLVEVQAETRIEVGGGRGGGGSRGRSAPVAAPVRRTILEEPEDPPLGGGSSNKKTGKTPEEQFAEDITRIRERTAALRLEIATVGENARARDHLLGIQGLINEAERAGLEITPERLRLIEQEAGAYAQVAEELDQLNESQRRMTELSNFAGDTMLDIFRDLVPVIETGNKALDGLISRLIEAALQAAIFGQGPFGGLFGGSSGGKAGGLVGAIFGGSRAVGGPIDQGKVYKVHKDEFIIPRSPGTVVPVSATGGGGPSITNHYDFRNADGSTVGLLRAEAERIKRETLAAVPETVRRASFNRVI